MVTTKSCTWASSVLLRHPVQARLHLEGVGGLRIALVGRPLVQLLVRQAQHRQPAASMQIISLTHQGLPVCCHIHLIVSEAQERVERAWILMGRSASWRHKTV